MVALKKSKAIPTNCDHCKAHIDGLCEGCTPETLRVVASYKSGDRKISAGQTVFHPGEPCQAIYNLVDGWVILYNLLENGRRQILHFAMSGAVLGFNPTRGAVATYGAQTLTDATLCIVPQNAFGLLSKDHPEIGMKLAWLISRDRNLSYDHLTSVGQLSARKRVAHLLLELFIRCRARWPGHRIEELHLPLTQEHIGDAMGLTGVHVNRVLRDLREDGVLEFHYGRLRILDPDKLLDEAGVDPHVALSWARRGPAV